jgi:hypothetical protein
LLAFTFLSKPSLDDEIYQHAGGHHQHDGSRDPSQDPLQARQSQTTGYSLFVVISMRMVMIGPAEMPLIIALQ